MSQTWPQQSTSEAQSSPSMAQVAPLQCPVVSHSLGLQHAVVLLQAAPGAAQQSLALQTSLQQCVLVQSESNLQLAPFLLDPGGPLQFPALRSMARMTREERLAIESRDGIAGPSRATAPVQTCSYWMCIALSRHPARRRGKEISAVNAPQKVGVSLITGEERDRCRSPGTESRITRRNERRRTPR